MNDLAEVSEARVKLDRALRLFDLDTAQQTYFVIAGIAAKNPGAKMLDEQSRAAILLLTALAENYDGTASERLLEQLLAVATAGPYRPLLAKACLMGAFAVVFSFCERSRPDLADSAFTSALTFAKASPRFHEDGPAAAALGVNLISSYCEVDNLCAAEAVFDTVIRFTEQSNDIRPFADVISEVATTLQDGYAANEDHQGVLDISKRVGQLATLPSPPPDLILAHAKTIANALHSPVIPDDDVCTLLVTLENHLNMNLADNRLFESYVRGAANCMLRSYQLQRMDEGKQLCDKMLQRLERRASREEETLKIAAFAALHSFLAFVDGHDVSEALDKFMTANRLLESVEDDGELRKQQSAFIREAIERCEEHGDTATFNRIMRDIVSTARQRKESKLRIALAFGSLDVALRKWPDEHTVLDAIGVRWFSDFFRVRTSTLKQVELSRIAATASGD